MELKPGSRLRSTVCSTEIIVIKPPAEASVSLRCGGADLVLVGADGVVAPGGLDPALSGGTLLGKRYVDEATGLEFLCTRPGEGTLTVDGRPLEIKAAVQLPTTD